MLATLTALTLVLPSAGIDGVVRGGGDRADLHVVALSSRDLRLPPDRLILAAAPVAPDSGAFNLATDGPAFLIVVAGCDLATIVAARLDQCIRYLPRLEPARSDKPVLLQLPDPELAQAVWSGNPIPVPPLRPVGAALIALGLGLGWWLSRRAGAAPPFVPTFKWRPLLLLSLVAAPLLLTRLGAEPLDLLEYSYFHEGMRPATTGAVLTDSISSELAHGPVQPLLLRLVGGHNPWFLRLASAFFGLGFVLLAWRIVRPVSESAAMGAALMALVSPVALYYSRDATPYALAGLCAAGTLALLVAPRRRWTWPAFAALHVLGFFAHYGYAAVPAAQLIALLSVARRRPRDLGHGLIALSCAAILPVALAPHLWTMFVSSGIRFSLMSPVYPDSPGLLTFVGTFWTVLSGLPSSLPWLALLTLPIWALGLRGLWRHSPLLGALIGTQALFIVLFLVFSHTMSTAVGGDKVFYAYRWTRPLLLGLAIPIGAAIAAPSLWLRGAAGLLILSAAGQSAAMVGGPVRPAQLEMARLIADHAEPGDAYAVLPAGFYGDPAQYHLTGKQPPSLITDMSARQLEAPPIFGPLVELDWPLETVLDTLHHDRVWVITYREEMFGTPKFTAAAARQTRAWFEWAGWTRTERWALAHLTVDLMTCGRGCQWRTRPMTVDLSDPLRAGRFVANDGTLSIPGDARHVFVGPADRPVWSREFRDPVAGIRRLVLPESLRERGQPLVIHP